MLFGRWPYQCTILSQLCRVLTGAHFSPFTRSEGAVTDLRAWERRSEGRSRAQKYDFPVFLCPGGAGRRRHQTQTVHRQPVDCECYIFLTTIDFMTNAQKFHMSLLPKRTCLSLLLSGHTRTMHSECRLHLEYKIPPNTHH